MTLSTTTSRITYAGNSVTTAFSFPYYFISSSDLVVTERVDATGVETLKTITTDYAVTGAGVAAGGTVTMVTATATGTTLVIYRSPAVTQDLDLVENDALPAEELEKRLDKVTMLAQRLSDRLDRSVRLTDAYSATFTPTLPSVLTPLYLMRVNAAGTGIDVVSQTSIATDPFLPTTTKGDLVVSTGSTNVRQAIGANNTVLTADSAQTNGLKWAKVAVASLDSASATSTQILTANGSGGAAYAAPATQYPQIAVVRDEKASGTDGGTATTGSFLTRTLNTLNNTLSYSWISLATNQITLTAGTYAVEASSPYRNTNLTKSKLRNITDSTDALIGSSQYSASGDNVCANSLISGVFTIAGTKVFELQYRVSNTAGTADLGVGCGFTVNEVYSIVTITKLA